MTSLHNHKVLNYLINAINATLDFLTPDSIVAALLRQCTGAYLQRVLAKFTENEHEKVDRLIELHFQYHERVAKSNAKIESLREVSISRAF